MKEIKVAFSDKYTNGKWATQYYKAESVEECIRINGLGKDCDYEILEVRDIDDRK